MPAFPREELEEMMRRWTEAAQQSEHDSDWTGLARFYTDDATCTVNIGDSSVYLGVGADEIRKGLLGEEMEGFDGWSYPYEHVVIDEKQGVLVLYWRQIAPFKRADGSSYEVAGLGVSYMRYAGHYKWDQQYDVFDLSQVKAVFVELAADGHLSAPLKRRIQKLAWGHSPRGYSPQPRRLSLGKTLLGYLALTRITLLGR